MTEDRLEFLESSWCNRNAHWSTYIFAGQKIEQPELEMATVAEWRDDIEKVIENREKVVYMVTVPRLYNTDETPETFFYNTHYFTFQVIVPDSKEEQLAEEEVRFKIFAGFARHYRIIDYLQEWDLNADIPVTHRLKMTRTTYAVEHFSRERLESDFFPRLETMMNEINTFVWTRLANDIHADLFFADKFKDMINLQLQGRTKPKQEQATRFTRNQLKFEPQESLPSTLVEVNEMTDGNNIVLATQNATAPQEDQAPKKLTLDQVPPHGFYVPLHKPAAGAYYLTIRKYHYTDTACATNADYVKRACYGPNPAKYKPALPFKMAQENYGSYHERESLPVTKTPS